MARSCLCAGDDLDGVASWDGYDGGFWISPVSFYFPVERNSVYFVAIFFFNPSYFTAVFVFTAATFVSKNVFRKIYGCRF